MYQFHGWFAIAETTEETDAGSLDAHIPDIRAIIDRLAPAGAAPSVAAGLDWLNGQPVVHLHGRLNRPRGDDEVIDELLVLLSERLPGSYGVLYESDDERTEPPGNNAFRVRTLARGRVSEPEDPFLSPIDPTIEG